MPIQVILVQHGEAVPEERDPERPLTTQGRADIERLGRFLVEARIRVPRILHSGKLRAHDSAVILAAKIGGDPAVETMDRITPKDSPVWLAEEIEGWHSDAMIVSHQPFLSRFVTRLLLQRESPYVVEFTPGTAVGMTRRGASRAWSLAWMVPPTLLRG